MNKTNQWSAAGQWSLAVTGIVLALSACARGQSASPVVVTAVASQAEVAASTGQPTVSSAVVAATSVVAGVDEAAPPSTVSGVTSPVVEPTDTAVTPGLDSTNRFCAAWSRFAGSFQIVNPSWLVGAEVGSNIEPGAIEASASQTMVAAYYEMGTEWPAEIADVKDVSLGTYQPMFQRVGQDVDRLRAAGASDEQLLAIAAWWESELATFDGVNFPDPQNAPAELVPFIDEAGRAIFDTEPPMPQDPELVVNSDPLVDMYNYLGANCPDQGLLGGRELEG